MSRLRVFAPVRQGRQTSVKAAAHSPFDTAMQPAIVPQRVVASSGRFDTFLQLGHCKCTRVAGLEPVCVRRPPALLRLEDISGVLSVLTPVEVTTPTRRSCLGTGQPYLGRDGRVVGNSVLPRALGSGLFPGLKQALRPSSAQVAEAAASLYPPFRPWRQVRGEIAAPNKPCDDGFAGVRIVMPRVRAQGNVCRRTCSRTSGLDLACFARARGPVGQQHTVPTVGRFAASLVSRQACLSPACRLLVTYKLVKVSKSCWGELA